MMYLMSKLSFDAPNVEKLILDTSEQVQSVIVYCPNLRSFQFTGVVNCIEVKDLSSLVDVTFNLGSQHMEFNEFEQFMAALKPVLSAEFISFSCESVDVLFYCMQKQLSEISMNWKRVELSMWLTEKHFPGICRWLRNSPYLEELVIYVTDYDRKFLKHIESPVDNSSMDDKECRSISPLKEFQDFEQFIAALKPLLRAQVLSISSEFVTVLFYCMEKQLSKVSMNWKRVELSMWMKEKNIAGLKSFVTEFTLLGGTCDTCYKMGE